jgi:hypothetical protein
MHVSNVEALYAAVNDAANAGATIELEPGTYVLTRNDPAGAARPNGGRLELQPDMSLVGQTGHPEAVVIDSSDPVNGPTFPIPGGNAGVIRIGRGRDRVEWLTVLGQPKSAGGVQTDLNGAAAPSVRVAHVVSRGNVRGIDVRNLGASAAGRRLTVDLDANEVFGNVEATGQGIRFVNSTADGASIVASLHGNQSHDNRTGFLAANLGSIGASVAIDSHDDRFEDNIVGGLIFGGINSGTTGSNGNSVAFTMHGGRFSGSHGSLGPPQNFTGALNIVGGLADAAGQTSDNGVRVSISGTRFEDNQDTDVRAWGARTSAPQPAGTNNVVSVDLHGVSAQAITAATDSEPAEPAGTNRATIVQ